jgi:drug/metabolite transporter (DMT)-like permease
MANHASRTAAAAAARTSSRSVALGWALALGSTVAFSFAPPVARAAILGGMDSNQLLMLRMLIATTLFGVTLAVTARDNLRLPRQAMGSAILVGAINAAGMILFFLSLNYLEASLGSMIIALSPPLVLSMLALRGERLTRRHLVRLGLALAGVYLLISPSGEVNWFGALLALVATFFFSLQMALTQWTLVNYPVRSVVFYVTATMTLFVVAWWLLQGAVWTQPSLDGWLEVLMLAVVSTYFARLGYYASIALIGSSQLALLGPLETMLSVLWSVLFLHEQLAAWQLLGGVLILASALLAVQRLGRVNLRLPRR